jgi:hypothetical protein
MAYRGKTGENIAEPELNFEALPNLLQKTLPGKVNIYGVLFS